MGRLYIDNAKYDNDGNNDTYNETPMMTVMTSKLTVMHTKYNDIHPFHWQI